MKETPEPHCLPRKSHHWAVRAMTGNGIIEEKVCVNCAVIATRVPPVIKNGQVVKHATYSYKPQ
jgi:hypothetical protein